MSLALKEFWKQKQILLCNDILDTLLDCVQQFSNFFVGRDEVAVPATPLRSVLQISKSNFRENFSVTFRASDAAEIRAQFGGIVTSWAGASEEFARSQFFQSRLWTWNTTEGGSAHQFSFWQEHGLNHFVKKIISKTSTSIVHKVNKLLKYLSYERSSNQSIAIHLFGHK
jgi:hypothetical protein